MTPAKGPDKAELRGDRVMIPWLDRFMFSERLVGIYASPFYAAVTALLGVIAGATVSLYATEIRGAFPLCWHSCEEPWAWPAAFFWVTAFLAFGLIFFRQHALDLRSNESFDRLAKVSQDSAALLASMPSPHFLAHFRRAYRDAELASRACIGEPSAIREQLEIAIRLVLQTVLSLARTFDPAPAEVVYGATLMLYRSSGALPEDESQVETIRNRLRFVEPETDLRKLRGVLDLDVALSTQDAEAEGFAEPDQRLIPFALPVPHEFKTADGRLRVLPGAPVAAFLSSDRMDAYADTTTLLTFLDERCALSGTVREDLARYFEGEVADAVRSFVSMGMRLDDDDPDPIGVLSLHSSAEDLLAGRKRASMFVPLMEPFLAILSSLLEQWRDTES